MHIEILLLIDISVFIKQYILIQLKSFNAINQYLLIIDKFSHKNISILKISLSIKLML